MPYASELPTVHYFYKWLDTEKFDIFTMVSYAIPWNIKRLNIPKISNLFNENSEFESYDGVSWCYKGYSYCVASYGDIPTRDVSPDITIQITVFL